MPLIMPLDELTKANEISDIAHRKNEPIFITRDGYSDLVVMSSEVYEEMSNTNRIDKAIYEAELEAANGGKDVDAKELFDKLEMKYFG
jgi:PHD/YefM family antitoxin component YafN of YafNO toxin-antitoxin module